jgi:ABC-type uncharacterized transport system permease subunit
MLLLAAAKIALGLLVLSAFVAGFVIALISAPGWLKAVLAFGPLFSAVWSSFWFPTAPDAGRPSR